MTIARTMCVTPMDYVVRALFRAGERGVWYDPSDLSTVFSDVAGTTPASVDGAVGKILDKSGNGKHLSAAADNTTRPTLRRSGGLYYLEFDGSNDAMSTASIDFSGGDSVTVFAGLRKLSDSKFAALAELSAVVDANAGSFFVGAPGGTPATNKLRWGSKGTSISIASATSASYVAPVTVVVTGIGKISTDVATLRVNGANAEVATTDQGTGNYGNYPLYVGARNLNDYFFTGYLYSLIVRGATTSIDQIGEVERYCNTRSGVVY